MTGPEDETALDAAHAVMSAAPGDDGARMNFYARLIEGELFLLLEQEAREDSLHPRVFPLDEGPVVLAFDSEARLSRFAGAPVPYAALPGRALAGMLAGQGLGLGLNLDVAPSAILLPPDVLDWLAGMLDHAPREVMATPRELHPPKGLPEALFSALDGRLARAAGLASSAWLAEVRYDDGARGHLLAIVGAAPGAERTLAQAVGEALGFSGLEAGALDVTFVAADSPLLDRIARTGLRFDISAPEPAVSASGPAAPGMDPDRPPRLK